MSVASSSVDAFTAAAGETYEVVPAAPGGEDVWDATDDNLQGPHNWRKMLSPVRTLSDSVSTTPEDEVTTDETSKVKVAVDANGVSTIPDESVVER